MNRKYTKAYMDCFETKQLGGETYGGALTRRINVGVEKWRNELDFGWCRRIVVFEDHLSAVKSVFPWSVLLPGDSILPEHEVHRTIGVLCGASDETEGMILAPGLSLLA